MTYMGTGMGGNENGNDLMGSYNTLHNAAAQCCAVGNGRSRQKQLVHEACP